ncbi:hypothetical protein [Archaeoglobus veneficus]|uniref:Uncharacterized protein n=1 Tax=Archaeoglobus veneficus (strain DSM 11195 / SNP6) TaxID=693661 RepID=F2KQ44_ARCVS|nr:hypothetical protein [Archaeoglobus veneficus]AEA47647.1 hypothetical protein Arcve_1647 [Archaeoglobus veneficus SNP6]
MVLYGIRRTFRLVNHGAWKIFGRLTVYADELTKICDKGNNNDDIDDCNRINGD